MIFAGKAGLMDKEITNRSLLLELPSGDLHLAQAASSVAS